ncbi:hypothetical protein CSQ87_10255 [Bifidobacterium simiarum]|uniref:Uncharacterized protein n=1 Tax=Bifidobacterium simiarum TaxID=2045441 RepID=A0A2M9HCA6_9BIFI|nr:hypothetical protein CSQ87_10255 [Bifidobacterium simiarum]
MRAFDAVAALPLVADAGEADAVDRGDAGFGCRLGLPAGILGGFDPSDHGIAPVLYMDESLYMNWMSEVGFGEVEDAEVLGRVLGVGQHLDVQRLVDGEEDAHADRSCGRDRPRVRLES